MNELCPLAISSILQKTKAGFGQKTAAVIAIPRSPSSTRRVVQLSLGFEHSIAVIATGTHGGHTGRVWTWGNGDHGRCGHGTESNANIPRQVEGIKDYRAHHVAAGYIHS